VWFNAEQLGFDAEERSKTFYLEGIYNSVSQGQEVVTLEVRPAHSTGSQFVVRDTIRATVAQVNLDIGSIETGIVQTGFDEIDEGADQAEETSAALIPVNDGDRDLDGYRDYVDGFDSYPPLQGAGNAIKAGVISSRTFTPIDLEVSASVDLTTSELMFAFNESNPKLVHYDFLTSDITPSFGQIRLWTKNGDAARNDNSVMDAGGGDYIPANTAIAASALGLTGSTRRVRLYLEGVRDSAAASDIRVSLNPEGTPLTRDFIDDVANHTVGDILIEG
jgi:hypothetical protein